MNNLFQWLGLAWTNEEIALIKLTRLLKASADRLHEAITGTKPISRSNAHMANPILNALAAQVQETVGVEASALALINGFAARMQAAVDAALAGGASAADLATLQTEIDALKASTSGLSAGVAANTPAV